MLKIVQDMNASGRVLENCREGACKKVKQAEKTKREEINQKIELLRHGIDDATLLFENSEKSASDKKALNKHITMLKGKINKMNVDLMKHKVSLEFNECSLRQCQSEVKEFLTNLLRVHELICHKTNRCDAVRDGNLLVKKKKITPKEFGDIMIRLKKEHHLTVV
jgi:hypothetical protein